MSNNPLTKKSALDSVKRILSENKVIVLFIILCTACILISGVELSYVAGEVATRFGRNTCLVLALIIPCLAGLGMNFGITVGAIAAQIPVFFVIHWGFTGVSAMLLCVLLATPLAVFFGYLVGKVYNATKGAEMIAGLVLGFFCDGLYRLFTLYLIGGVIPYDDPNLLPRGFGLRNSFDLTGKMKYVIDDISFLTTLTVISAVAIAATLVIGIHGRKVGRPVDKKQQVSKLLAYTGVLVFSIAANFIPFLKATLGGSRLILANAIALGGMAVIAYAVVMLAIRRPALKSAAFKKYVKLGVIAGILMAVNCIPAVNKVFAATRISSFAYAIICLFCFFNNWILSTRLGQNMRTVGQSRSVATSAGIDVDKTRIIATCISTVLASWGQLIFLQNLGTFNSVMQQSSVGLYAVAAILVGGANVQKANNKQAVLGVLLFHTLFVVAPLAATKLVGDSAVSEYIRMFISYGVIAVSLAMHASKSSGRRKPDAEGMTAVMIRPVDPGSTSQDVH